ncbi:hypothetical protein TNCV_3759311, partial [Trichonephila clavipes]
VGNSASKFPEVIGIRLHGAALKRDTSFRRMYKVFNGQPIGVTVHYTQQPIREQSLSSQPSQKLFQTQHPDEAPKPRLPDLIDHPITVMPPSRM